MIKEKKPWAKPVLILIASSDVRGGANPAFNEVSQPGPNTFVITKNTPLHSASTVTINDWNNAHS